MSNFNQVVEMGRLVADPEKQEVGDGLSLTKFTIAVNRIGKDDETDFFDCEAWRKTADVVAAHKSKGDLIQVVGRLKQSKWKNKEGQTRSKVLIVADNVIFLPSKNDAAGGNSNVASGDGDTDSIPF